MNFDSFSFCDSLMDGLDSMGFEKPTPIQEKVIPLIMSGKDLIACAQTGTGKTAAYILPTLNRIALDEIPHTSALILAPTRELALQIDQAFQGFAYFTHASSLAVYGGGDGQTFEKEKKALSIGTSVIIATPGRLISHLNLGYVKFDKLDVLILDEADKMLDMGFYEDLIKIMNFLPAKRQNLLFSATMPPKMRELAKRTLKDPAEVSIAISKPAAGIQQSAYLVYDDKKISLCSHILENRKDQSVLIFASTKSGVKALEKELRRVNLSVKSIHSDLTQEERENVLLGFKNRSTNILVATDILSRGIDIENISLVINFDVPHDAEDYVHRIGRTARADTKGEAITFINEKDQKRFAQIEELIEKEVSKTELPEHLGKGPAWNPQATKMKRNFNNKKFRRKPGQHRRNSGTSGQ